MNNMNTLSSTRSDTSSNTFSSSFDSNFFFIIAMLSMPPAIPAIMYASISGIPCIAYLSMLNPPT